MSGRGPGACGYSIHTITRVVGAGGGERNASEKFGALAPAVGVGERGTSG